MSLGGAIIGGIIGGIFWGGWGAAIGAAIGGMTGNGSDDSDVVYSAPEPEEADTDTEPEKEDSDTSIEHWEALFRAFGKIAKTDGVVSREEADIVGAFLRQTGLPSDLRKKLIAAFNAGKTDKRPFRALIDDVADNFESNSFDAIMTALCSIVLADGEIDDREIAMLREAEKVLKQNGFVDRWLQNVRRDRDAEEERRREPPPRPEAGDDLSWAYRQLGLPPNSSDDDVKKAWRTKAKEFHPDVLRGKGVNEYVIRLAEEQMRQVNAAYEAIKKAHGF